MSTSKAHLSPKLSQNKVLEVDPAYVNKGIVCSPSTSSTSTSISTAKTSQVKAFGLEISCRPSANLLEGCVSSITNTRNVDINLDQANRASAASATVDLKNKPAILHKSVHSQQDDPTNLGHNESSNYAIRCLKSGALENTDQSVAYLPFASVNHPSSTGTTLKTENIKSYPKSTAKVVKVSHIKWHAVNTASGSVYSCACCGLKNIAIDSVINHVQKKCVSSPQLGQHDVHELPTLDLPPTESDASKVTLEYTFQLNNNSISKIKEQSSVPVSLKGDVGKNSVGIINRFKPVGNTVIVPHLAKKSSDGLVNDSFQVKPLSESSEKDAISSNNDTLLNVDLENTVLVEKQSESETPILNPVRVCLASLSNTTVAGRPKTTFKYIIRNSSKIGVSAVQNLKKLSTSLLLNKGGTVFKCKNCRKGFKSKLWLSTHQDSCTPGKFLCLICGKSFSVEIKLTRHIETHGLSPATCTICNETFRNELMLKTHMMLHTGEHPHKCSICGEGFIFSKSLAKHLLTEHHKRVAKDFKCSQCNKSFTSERNLTCHKDREHSGNQSNHLCSICGKTYEKMHSLKNHMAVHGPRNHACKLCGYKAYSVQLLNQHIMRHKNERNHTCEKCGSSFYRMTELKRHNFNHHTDELPEQCTLCNKAFKFPNRLKQHLILVHNIIPEGRKVFNCEICKKPFIVEGKFRDHMNIHTGNRPYECDTCQRTFRSLKTFTNHKKIHSKTKDPKNSYQCDSCDKAFKTHRTLYWHQQNVHVRGTPFTTMISCDLCERSFPNLWVLNRHRLGSHSVVGPLGESHQVKPNYECKVCKIRYEDQSDLLKHSEEVHCQNFEVGQSCVTFKEQPSTSYSSISSSKKQTGGSRKRTIINRDKDRPYGCDECDKNYASRIGLYQHRRQVHRPDSQPRVDREVECNHCFKIFSSYASLYQHRRYTHSVNVKPIPCGTCGKAFKLKTSLKAHMQTHLSDSDRTTFHCNICNRDLKTRSAHNVHMQIHMGIKPYACQVCGHKFLRKKDRDVHQGKHGSTLLQTSVLEEYNHE